MIQGQEVIVPVAVCVRPDVRSAPSGTNDPDLGALPVVKVDDVECICFRVDAADDFLASPLPSCLRISQMRDVLVWTLRVRLGDTCHSNVSHCVGFPLFRY